VPPLTAIRPQVEYAAKMAKAQPTNAVLERLISAAHIKVESDKYAGAVPQFGTTVASAR
jgi:hypothetical protein